jgi:UDP:flavonoid glycosyltransferase YjiC (YdhE family)
MLTLEPVTGPALARPLGSLLASDRVRRRCERFRDEVDPVAGTSLAADWIEERLAGVVAPRPAPC